MEPSQVIEAAGEFSDNESGWTTYIGSPILNQTYNHDEQSVAIEEFSNNGNGDDNNDDNNNDSDSKDTGDEDSDDSMASDASSGPSHLQFLCINSDGSQGSDQLKDATNDHEKLFPGKKASKQESKTKHERRIEKEDESLLEADTAGSHV